MRNAVGAAKTSETKRKLYLFSIQPCMWS